MKLHELLERIHGSDDRRADIEGVSGDPEIERVEYDSRRVGPGTLFACVPGDRADGHDFAAAAAEAGAAALLCERRLDVALPQIVTPGVRGCMGVAAGILAGRPSESMKMIAVTGTNGKTTTSYITRSIMRASGETAGMIGTIVYDDGGEEIFAGRTTPEGPDTQALLARMRANGARCCVMEASSHGLEQGRLDGISFDAAGFCGLAPEHLEFHPDMESYFQAKRKLFTGHAKSGARFVINADDEHGRRLLAEFPASSVGFSTRSAAGGIYGASMTSCDIDGTSLELTLRDGVTISLKSPLIGEHNAANAILAAALAYETGTGADAIKAGIEGCPQVPGRLERMKLSNGAVVFVDYAHNPDGIERVLDTLRALTRRELSIVWGAGGDRSRRKRPVIGGIMAMKADNFVITTDNPRSEDPARIADDVKMGALAARDGARFDVILDRREAIRRALDRARAGDVVVVAGKGPEREIIYADRRVPFSDTGTVAEWASDSGIELLP